MSIIEELTANLFERTCIYWCIWKSVW